MAEAAVKTSTDTSRPKAPRMAVSSLPRMKVRSYDAAAVSRHTQNHFLYADGRDADSIIRADLPTLRNRCRYEIRNNSYAKGIVETKANDIVGTGPRPQVKSGNNEFDKEVEEKFSDWCGRCDITGILSFGEILRLAGSVQQDESGESIIVLQNDMYAGRDDVSLRLLLVEPDRLQSPFGQGWEDEKLRDGIEFNEFGRPLRYHILKSHPGSSYNSKSFFDYDTVPAEQVIHLYRTDRPGQTRGVPWFTPAIPLFALLRRYTLAVIEAAETAANLAGVIYSDMLAEESAEDIETMDVVDIERNALLTLPAGYKAEAFKPEQPSSTYESFKREILNEAARCLLMPYNVAAANSASYNYASGRLDHQGYFKAIRTVQGWIERKICSRVFNAWLMEAWLSDLFETQVDFVTAQRAARRCSWFWPGTEHVDPDKESRAQERRLANRTTTLAYEYARQGKDWEDELEQIAKEQAKMKELGLINVSPETEKPDDKADDEKEDEDLEDEKEEKND